MLYHQLVIPLEYFRRIGYPHIYLVHGYWRLQGFALIRSLFRAAELVCFGIEPILSDDTDDGNAIPMTRSARSWGGDSRCSEWLQFVSQGVGPMAPAI